MFVTKNMAIEEQFVKHLKTIRFENIYDKTQHACNINKCVINQ